MTLVIPIICSNGLVVAADSMMSVSIQDNGQHFDVVNYPEMKISSFNNENTIVAFTGDLGLAQKFKQLVNSNPNSFTCDSFRDYPEKLSKLMREYIQSLKLSDVPIMTPVLGYVHDNQIYCCKFNADFLPQFLEGGTFFWSLGTGVVQSLPFLRYLTRVLCPDAPQVLPDIERGTLIAYWSIRYAIETSTGKIDHPIRVHIIHKDLLTDSISNYELDSGKIIECEEYIEDAERGIVEWFNKSLEKSARIPKRNFKRLI